ncbi:MAG: hypothetical protein ACRCYU_03050 [Nocardioides sp.]
MDLTASERTAHYIEMWKKTVDVQQHFNDIEWRIRGLALTVATFALGAAGVAAKDGTAFGPISLGTVVLVIGLILWYAFYFVDRVWYHPLLKAAVKQGTLIEDEIRKVLPSAGMTAAITAGSPQEMGRLTARLSRRDRMHSDDKLAWFYKVGALALGIAAVALQVGTLLHIGLGREQEPIRVRIDQPVVTEPKVPVSESSPVGPTTTGPEPPRP